MSLAHISASSAPSSGPSGNNNAGNTANNSSSSGGRADSGTGSSAAAAAAAAAAATTPIAASYLGVGHSITPVADDSRYQLDLIPGVAPSNIGPSTSFHAHLASNPHDSSFAPTNPAFTLGPGGTSGNSASAAITGLDPSFLKVGGNTTFDFPSLPDGLLDEAPEYEYVTNVFEAAQEYLADFDGARVFDLDSFDPTLAGLGGDESLWSFAEGLDLSLTHLHGHPNQHSHIAGPSTTSHFGASDPLLMASSALASASATPHLHTTMPDDNSMGYGAQEDLHHPGTDSSSNTPSAQYALNYLPQHRMSGSQTAPAYPALFHPSQANQMNASASSMELGGVGDDSMPASKRRRGLSPRTAPVYDENFGKASPFQQQRQQHQHQQQSQYHQHQQQHQQQSHSSFLPGSDFQQHRGSNASPMPNQAHPPYSSGYAPFNHEGKSVMYPPPPPLPHHEGNGTSSSNAHLPPYSRAHPPYPTTATPATMTSRSRMTSWHGSPYPSISGPNGPATALPGGPNGGAEWGMDSNAPAHPGMSSSATYPSIVGPSPDLNHGHSGYPGHRLSEVSVASSSISAAAAAPPGVTGGSKSTFGNSVPSGGGYHSGGRAGLGIGSAGAAGMGLVPVVGVPVGPGSTISIGPSPNQQAEIIHPLGQALDATSDADGVARCPYPNCNKTFAKNRTYNLKAHLRSHSQLKPFACASCPRAFSRKHDLERHARVHSGDKPYICEVCGRGFPRSDALRRHWRVEKECGHKVAEMEAQQTGSGMGGAGTSSIHGEAGGSVHSDEDETSSNHHAGGAAGNSSDGGSNASSSHHQHQAYGSHESQQQQQQQQQQRNGALPWGQHQAQFASHHQHSHPYQHQVQHQQQHGYSGSGPSGSGDVVGEKRKR
ncbi:unnamed protein product [Tilletia controversa]|nr:unnamed protein product [Tilletia controversa]